MTCRRQALKCCSGTFIMTRMNKDCGAAFVFFFELPTVYNICNKNFTIKTHNIHSMKHFDRFGFGFIIKRLSANMANFITLLSHSKIITKSHYENWHWILETAWKKKYCEKSILYDVDKYADGNFCQHAIFKITKLDFPCFVTCHTDTIGDNWKFMQKEMKCGAVERAFEVKTWKREKQAKLKS